MKALVWIVSIPGLLCFFLGVMLASLSGFICWGPAREAIGKAFTDTVVNQLGFQELVDFDEEGSSGS
jgi:hypothetical protein